uniref:Uncharacterized protein n=1 Tax=Rhizobium leguminosarum TaxID=384 RepID=A0A154IHU4_RHILE|nr:hypothetical protein A4A59_20535 [Rhizobium leguminosarum]
MILAFGNQHKIVALAEGDLCFNNQILGGDPMEISNCSEGIFKMIKEAKAKNQSRGLQVLKCIWVCNILSYKLTFWNSGRGFHDKLIAPVQAKYIQTPVDQSLREPSRPATDINAVVQAGQAV